MIHAMVALFLLLSLVSYVHVHPPEHPSITEHAGTEINHTTFEHNDSYKKTVEKNKTDNYDSENISDEYHHYPLVTVIDTKPHSMTLMVKPKFFKPNTVVRLLYERVPVRRKANMEYLDDPVVEYLVLIRSSQSYHLTELPKGKYIVCGEAMVHGEVYQASCCENKIERIDNKALQPGVKIIIFIAILLVILVIIYAVVYKICKRTINKNAKKQLEIEKCHQVNEKQ